MLALAKRLPAAFLGAATATFVVALLETRAVSAGTPASTGSIFFSELGVLAPVPLFLAGATAGLVAFERVAGAPLIDDLRDGRAARESRLRAAAIAPLAVLAFFFWAVASAHLVRTGLGWPTASAPAVGLGIAVGSIGIAIGAVALCLAVLPFLVRRFEELDRVARSFADPYATGPAALACATLLALAGVATGDSGGTGGAPGLGILGVLTRPELDLRSIAELLFVLGAAYATSVVVAKRTKPAWTAGGLAASAAALILFGGMCARASSALDDEPAVADGITRAAPVGGATLAFLRRLSDHDHDGYSAHFGGGDCNDDDPRINPSAFDVPGNGIDEDCTGADTPAPTPEPPPMPTVAVVPHAKRTYNVVYITVDTLRADLGFAGYPKPVTPNLDALAARSTVFEQAYSMASYTAKSVGPTLIGKYPSETFRDWDHFTTYYPQNTFVAERLKAAGQHTLAGMCHYYFNWSTGYKQGFAVWDASAIPQGMSDNDSSLTSERMTDLAVSMLGKPSNSTPEPGDGGEPRRFFAWFHYFDPHLQYVRHPDAPAFATMPGSPANRVAYDEEVWFTDKHMGRLFDFIASKPWAADTAIIVTADHGEGFGEHGIIGHGREIWQPLVRVPLIVFIPDASARRIGVKRSHIDLAPTILELMGVEAPAGELRGESLGADIFAAPDAVPVERDVLIDMPEGPYNGIRRALITGPTPGMKLIHFGGARYSLFDLMVDPTESKDLSSDKAQFTPVLARMNEIRARLKEVAVTGEKKND